MYYLFKIYTKIELTSTYPRLIFIVRYIPVLDGCISVHVYSRDKLSRQVNESEFGDVSETASNVQNNNMNDYFSTYNEFYIMRAGKNRKKMSSSGLNTNTLSNFELNKRELRLDNFFYENLLSNNEFTKYYFSKDLDVRYFNDEIFNSIEEHLRGDRLKLTKQYNRIASSSLHFYINTFIHSNERISLGNNFSSQLSFKNRNRSMLNILCSPSKQKSSTSGFLGSNDNSLDLVIHSVLSKIISENKSVLRKNIQKEKKLDCHNFAMTSPLKSTVDINGFSVTKIAVLKTILSYLNGVEDESSFMLSEDYSFMDAGVINRRTSNDFNFNDMSLLFSNISFEQIYKNHIQNYKNTPFTKGASDSQTTSSHNMSYRIHPKINQKKERELLDMINSQLSEIGLINHGQKTFSPIANKNPRSRKTAVINNNWESSKLQQQKLSEKRAFSLGQSKLSPDILNLMSEISIDSFKKKNSNNQHSKNPFLNEIANTKDQTKSKFEALLYSSTDNDESPFSIKLKPASVFNNLNHLNTISNISSESDKASDTPTANKEMMKDNYRVSEETENDMSGSYKESNNPELINFNQENKANPYFDAINFSVKAISSNLPSSNTIMK